MSVSDIATKDSATQKPKLPPKSGSWWKKGISEITDEQAELRREYYRQYRQWRKENPSEKERKLPEDASEWWNKPVADLTQKQLDFRREYVKLKNRENYNKEEKILLRQLKNDAKKFRQIVEIINCDEQ